MTSSSLGDIPASLQHIEQQAAGIHHLLAVWGEHGTTLSLLRALSRRIGPLALVHFDALVDTWPTNFGQTYAHGSVFYHALQERPVEPTHMIQIGIRSPVEREVWDWTIDQGVQCSRRRGFEHLAMPNARLWAEPGRALVASAGWVVVQAQHRRGNALFINDGVYGALADAGAPGFRYPVRLLRPFGAAQSNELVGFKFCGPTCDSADVMHGPFHLPADIAEGDWIEIGQLGAYGGCMRTAFNGFDRARLVEVRDSAAASSGSISATVPVRGLADAIA